MPPWGGKACTSAAPEQVEMVEMVERMAHGQGEGLPVVPPACRRDRRGEGGKWGMKRCLEGGGAKRKHTRSQNKVQQTPA